MATAKKAYETYSTLGEKIDVASRGAAYDAGVDYGEELKKQMAAGADYDTVYNTLTSRINKANSESGLSQYAWDDITGEAVNYLLGHHERTPTAASSGASGGYASGGSYAYGSSGGGATDHSGYLEELYNAKTEANVAALQEAYDKNIAQLEAAKAEIPGMYDSARNRTAASAAQSQRNFDQAAAAAGLNSGTGAQARLSNNVALQGDLERYAYPTRSAARESDRWQELNAEREALRAQLAGYEVNDTVSPDTWGMERMREAAELQEAALTGTDGLGRFVGETLISVGQNAATLPLAAINPAAPLAAMGTIAAGSRAAELNAGGVAPGEALVRGLASGGIEALTEKIPLDSVLRLFETGGTNVITDLLIQAGTEASEEAVSYAANWLADKAAGDPNATFTLQELARAAASGALSGLIMGGGATAAGRLSGMTDAAQRRWTAAEAWGLTEEEYLRYYPIYSASGEGKTKAVKIAELVAAGMTQAEAEEFWRIMAVS